MLIALPCSYIRSTIAAERTLALDGIVDGLELAPLTEPHRALEVHAAELAGRPRDAEHAAP